MEDKDWLWALRITQMEPNALMALAKKTLNEKANEKYSHLSGRKS